MVTFNFAYVRYRDDQKTAIVNVKDISKFDQATHEPSRCYWVLWSKKKENDTGSGDDEKMEIDDDENRPRYYKAQILLLGETEEELTERIANGPRLKIPKVIDSSIESMTESEDDDCPGPSQQKRKLEEEQHLNKEKTITAKKSKDAALKNIMAKKINERSNSSSFASSMSTSKTTKTAVVKKTNTTTTTPVIPSNSSNSSCANCKIQSSKLKKLTEKNESLEEEVARLSELNRRLQVEVLDKFNTVTGISTATTGRTSQTGQTPGISAADDPARKDSEVKYMAQDGQVGQ
nr:uncharacterized protein LOC129283846 [Lytechinus pictus]